MSLKTKNVSQNKKVSKNKNVFQRENVFQRKKSLSASKRKMWTTLNLRKCQSTLSRSSPNALVQILTLTFLADFDITPILGPKICTWIVVVTVGTMEAEVGVTLVEAVRLVGAMMEGRGESTVEGINIVVTRATA